MCQSVYGLSSPSTQPGTSLNFNKQSERRFSSRIVTTKYGALRGFIVDLPGRVNLQPVEVFLGTPYASPPVGKLRFMPPVTPAHWNGVKSAHSPGPVCPQNLPNISNTTEALKTMTTGRLRTLKRLIPLLLNQSEDCLYLNIFTPYPSSVEISKLPVIVFIHGESYEYNSGSSYDGSVLASYGNVVVVTINYRLGVLGFFPALDGSSRGNFGLMDQVAALHWVQENIAEFGGDSGNVTVLGHGQGAACINILMLSPMAKGLFHRAIMHSGTGLSPWAMASDAVDYSRRLAVQVGCLPLGGQGDNYHQSGGNDNLHNVDYGSQMIDCLRGKDFRDLILSDIPVPSQLTSLGPTIDGIVIPDIPGNLMNSAQYNQLFGNIDLLIGTTSREYFKFTGNEESSGIEPEKQNKIVRTLVRNLYNFHLQEIFHTIFNEYTDWTKYEHTLKDNLQATSDIISDGTVISQAIKVAQLHSKLSSSSAHTTYLYTFEYSTKKGDYHSSEGCVHGEDLAYIFGSPLIDPTMSLGYFISDYTPEETELSARLITYWTNFVRTGRVDDSRSTSKSDYNHGDNHGDNGYESKPSSLKEIISWPQYDERSQKYLSINLEPIVKDHYRAHQLSVWLNLIPKIHLPGPGPLTYQHHLLTDHDDLSTYDGFVRSTASFAQAMMRGLTSSPSSSGHLSIEGSPLDTLSNNNHYLSQSHGSDNDHRNQLTSSWPGSTQIYGTGSSLMATSPVSVINNTNSHDNSNPNNQPNNSNLPFSQQQQFSDQQKVKSMLPQSTSRLSNGLKQIKDESSSSQSSSSSWEDSFHFKWNGPYSTALSVTIAIGFTFLILNGLILAAFFYKRGRPSQLTQSVNDSSTINDKSRAISNHPPTNHFNDSINNNNNNSKKQGGNGGGHHQHHHHHHHQHNNQHPQQQIVHGQNQRQSSLPESPFKLSTPNSGINIMSTPLGLISTTGEGLGMGGGGRTGSPSIKADVNTGYHPVDYIASHTGLMSLNSDLTADLLESQTGDGGGGDVINLNDHLINNSTGYISSDMGSGGGGGLGMGHVSMCNSIYYSDKCPTLPRLISSSSTSSSPSAMTTTTTSSSVTKNLNSGPHPMYRTISQSKFVQFDEPREFHEMNI